MISLDTKLAISKEQVSCDLGGEAVFLNLKNGEYFGLDPIGARIWQLLQDGQTLREIHDRLLDEYIGVDAEGCTRDLLNLVKDLIEADLVEASN